MHQRVASHLGTAPARVVDIVALERDQVAAADGVDGPVVVPVAGRRPAGATIELAVGDGDAVGRRLASDEHLAADEGDLGR